MGEAAPPRSLGGCLAGHRSRRFEHEAWLRTVRWHNWCALSSGCESGDGRCTWKERFWTLLEICVVWHRDSNLARLGHLNHQTRKEGLRFNLNTLHMRGFWDNRRPNCRTPVFPFAEAHSPGSFSTAASPRLAIISWRRTSSSAARSLPSPVAADEDSVRARSAHLVSGLLLPTR